MKEIISGCRSIQDSVAVGGGRNPRRRGELRGGFLKLAEQNAISVVATVLPDRSEYCDETVVRGYSVSFVWRGCSMTRMISLSGGVQVELDGDGQTSDLANAQAGSVQIQGPCGIRSRASSSWNKSPLCPPPWSFPRGRTLSRVLLHPRAGCGFVRRRHQWGTP